MSTYVVLINGPPGSGKDMLADFLLSQGKSGVDEFSVVKREFKARLNEHTVKHFGVAPKRWAELTQRAFKEIPTSELKGLSPRQALIHVAENVCKPNYGKNYFAEALVASIAESENTVVVVPDCGFAEEVECVASSEVTGFGRRVLLVQLSREGCTFAGDSRGYVNIKDVGAGDVQLLQNSGTPEEVGRRFQALVGSWVRARR